jgi:hypothetical protein
MRRTKKPTIGPAWLRTASTWIPIRISQRSSPNPTTSAPSTSATGGGLYPSAAEASEELNRIDDVGQDQHHAGDQDHATHNIGDGQ